MIATPAAVEFEALGSTATVLVAHPDRLESARGAVQRTVDAFDRACSRFRGDSELSAVNRAAGSPVPVSPLLRDAVLAALRAARLTDGDVDPTVGTALIALGYDRDFAALTDASRPQAARGWSFVPAAGWRTVELDAKAGTIRLAAGVGLDLGATAKALAADRAAEAAHQTVGCGVLVSLGGDLAIAGEPPPGGWRVRVTDDHRAESGTAGQWVLLSSGGLATSSTSVRRWRRHQRHVHHLVDPITGAPAAGPWRTVSVAAATCLDANIASTAAIIRGERAAAWLQSQNLPSRLVARDGALRHLAGWPAEGEERG